MHASKSTHRQRRYIANVKEKKVNSSYSGAVMTTDAMGGLGCVVFFMIHREANSIPIITVSHFCLGTHGTEFNPGLTSEEAAAASKLSSKNLSVAVAHEDENLMAHNIYHGQP